jgi:flagellar biogenesis protein FliO
MNDPKTAVDVGAAAVAGLSWAQILPNISAVLAIIWFLIRIYETRTVQKMIGRNNGQAD